MDDLGKDIFEIWKLRLRIERLKKKNMAIEWEIESEEYKLEHSQLEYQEARALVDEFKREISEIEADQYKLEDKVKLPNPYLKKPD